MKTYKSNKIKAKRKIKRGVDFRNELRKGKYQWNYAAHIDDLPFNYNAFLYN